MSDSYRDLLVWQKAMALAADIYETTERFPQREIYGLTLQVRKASVSVPSNIAEGKGRLSKKEFVQFLGRARGSLMEVETQLELSCMVKFLAPEDRDKLFEKSHEVGRLLNGLIRKIRKQLADDAPES